MGNRCVICTREKDVGIYLHWNGGRDSVEAFLRYCKIQGFRPPETDSYGWARLCQVIANFMGGSGLSVGIQKYSKLDCNNGDNGLYIIEDWEIVGREFFNRFEQHEYPLDEMLIAIDKSQPQKMQLGEYLSNAEDVKVGDLKIGDKVWMHDFDGFNKYENDETYMDNRNNYIEKEIVRREKTNVLS